MALLSADDVLNKRFQPTKFREGYDQDEVDDFLDEIVNTLRAVYAENDDLKAKLQAAEERVAELSRGEGVAVAEPVQVPEREPEREPEPAPVQQFAPQAAPEQPAQSGPESAAGMLALAQRLHDEYVANGREEADRLVSEARSSGENIVREAENTRDQTLKQLEGERSNLERKIDELRTFEREYRNRLTSYLEGLLADIEQRGSISGENA
ncbi:MAG TPA: DivIVA domain-containing protein [Actinomycetaceae bacterium]|nr:DivIVA domain-containing protein [Actinomycetaceae bacterium]